MAAPLLADASAPMCWIADYPTSAPPRPADLATVSASLEEVLAADLAGAQCAVGAPVEEFLLAALGRTVARTTGGGVILVDVDAAGGDRRQVAVPCVSGREVTGDALLASVHTALDTADRNVGTRADVAFSYRATTAATATADGCLLSLHAYRRDNALALDWHYDTRSFDQHTVQELAEQFPLALVEITSG